MSKPRGNNLVALGSAAVLIIYTAGFAKTKPAADRMAAESAERRPRSASRTGAGAAGARTGAGESGEPMVPSMPVASVVKEPVGVPASTTPGAVTSSVAPPPTVESSNLSEVLAPKTHTASTTLPGTATVVKVPVVSQNVSAQVATIEAALVSTVSAPVTALPVVAPLVTPPSAPVIATPVSSAPAPSAPVSTPAPPPAAAPAAKPAAKTSYKDGVYLGRGTSRHGDIEAMVEIRDGRIANAVISQCLTRYSCSWIAVLVPQVVARQSAEVDYVSGATVSSDAFYYAVTQALAQAK
ncbi:FMN-binding protein [Gemmatimonas sp.]|uniref:FMN-binding protein n=1 Tax=Gemmatimonas sp. TaxID=1962908 RepID=UPI00356AF421